MASRKKTFVREEEALDSLLAPRPREAAPARPRPAVAPVQKAKPSKPKARPSDGAAAPAGLEAFRVYSLREVSAVVGVSTRTLLEYIKSGRLKATKIGVRWKVSPDNLRAFINGDGGPVLEADDASETE